MQYERCKQMLLAMYPDSKMVAAYALPTAYIFALLPKDAKDGEYLAGFFKVSPDGKEITEYSPVMDTSEFKRALKNRIE